MGRTDACALRDRPLRTRLVPATPCQKTNAKPVGTPRPKAAPSVTGPTHDMDRLKTDQTKRGQWPSPSFRVRPPKCPHRPLARRKLARRANFESAACGRGEGPCSRLGGPNL